MIEVENLHKVYGDLIAVDHASFYARPGEIFGLLGPNGAGKSTTIGCLCGLLTPSAGSVRIHGHDIVRDSRAAKQLLGVVPQEIALHHEMRARENLDYWGSAQGLSGANLKNRIADTLAATGLADRANDFVKNYSGGMKRRLNFAAGILHQPKVVLLDEPTVGVDPQSRVRLLDLVRQLASEGACVLYTTHYMEEAETLCDRLAVLDHGNIIAQGSLDELRAMVGERDLLRLTGTFPATIHSALLQEPDVEIVGQEESLLRLSIANGPARLAHLLATLSTAGAEIRNVTLTQPSLESLFIKLTGKELRE